MDLPRKQSRLGLLLLAASVLGWAVCLAVASVRLRGLLMNSTLLAGGTLLISIPVGTFLAVAIAKTSLWGRRLLERCLIALLFVPLYVQAAAWQAAAGQAEWIADPSWLTGWRGAIWIHAMAAIPWVVLFVVATLREVPRELEEEALQDAAAWRVLLRVSLPRAATGIVAAALWISVLCFGEIAVTDLYQVRTFAEEIYTAASLGTLDRAAIEPMAQQLGLPAAGLADVPQFSNVDLQVGLLAVLLGVTAALTAIWMWVPVADFVSPATNWGWQLGRGRWSLSLVSWLLTAIVVGAPLLGLIGEAGSQITRDGGQINYDWSPAKAATLVLVSPWEHRREFVWSLLIGGVATTAATALAIMLAWAVRTHYLPKLPTALLLSAGFAIPGPLLGIWLIRCLNQPPDSLFAPLTWCYDHTILAPVAAHVLRAVPLTTLLLAAQFANLPQEVLESARSEGAGWWRQLGSIALPWYWRSVTVAAGMAMIVSLSDLGATLLVVPPGVSPLSIRIFGLLHYGAEDRVSALCLVLALMLCVAASIAGRLPSWINRSLSRKD